MSHHSLDSCGPVIIGCLKFVPYMLSEEELNKCIQERQKAMESYRNSYHGWEANCNKQKLAISKITKEIRKMDRGNEKKLEEQKLNKLNKLKENLKKYELFLKKEKGKNNSHDHMLNILKEHQGRGEQERNRVYHNISRVNERCDTLVSYYLEIKELINKLKSSNFNDVNFEIKYNIRGDEYSFYVEYYNEHNEQIKNELEKNIKDINEQINRKKFDIEWKLRITTGEKQITELIKNIYKKYNSKFLKLSEELNSNMNKLNYINKLTDNIKIFEDYLNHFNKSIKDTNESQQGYNSYNVLYDVLEPNDQHYSIKYEDNHDLQQLVKQKQEEIERKRREVEKEKEVKERKRKETDRLEKLIKKDYIKKVDNVYFISDKRHEACGKQLYLSSKGKYYYEDKHNSKFFLN